MQNKKITQILIKCAIFILLCCTLILYSYALDYSTTGYQTSTMSGKIYFQNNLNNSSIYSNHLATAIAYWHNSGLLGREFVINTSSDSQIYNMDFFQGSDYFKDLHFRDVLAVTRKWGQSQTYCTCHTTVAFDIVCNDRLLQHKSVTKKRATLVHELGHLLGLIDYEDSNENISIMSYITDWDVYCMPFVFDVTNANDCWAPHYTP